MKFRKKPVVIDAIRNDDTLGYTALSEFMRGGMFMVYEGYILIDTLEGQMKALRGDWIIKGVKGEFYPCKPDIFAATYEPVEPQGEPAKEEP